MTPKSDRGQQGDTPIDRLKHEARSLAGAAGGRALSAVLDRAESTADRLTDYAEGGGPGLVAAVTGARKLGEGKSPGRALLSAGGGAIKESVAGLFGRRKKGGQAGQRKITNIVESIDVGVPVRVAYDQWTQFRDFPSFMKKVESVEQESAEKLNWKAQVFWSHRTWQSTIVQQVPDQKIVWRSKGPKGYVDGAVTFHEIGPEITRILVVLEYHPQGLFERTGNIWRAQGRRARLELKHFRRHVMTQTILRPEDLTGWRGTIEDGEVVTDHETAMRQEQDDRRDRESRDAGADADDLDEGDDGRADEPQAGRDDTPADDSAEPDGSRRARRAGARPAGRRPERSRRPARRTEGARG
ncbi:MAG: SRPBCC family protein [Streptosporangiaceae bacterium]